MKKCKVLIVDDIPNNVEAVSEMIQEFDFDIQKAFNGKEAIEKIDSFLPNIILLDLMMPGTNGWDIIEYVRAKFDKSQMAIIVTSLLSNKDNIDECYEMGVNDYVTKPIIKSRLIKIGRASCRERV